MKNREINKWDFIYKVFSLIAIFLLVFSIAILYLQKQELENDKEYYKEQMLNFCESLLLQQEILIGIYGNEYPAFEESCDYFILSWDE